MYIKLSLYRLQIPHVITLSLFTDHGFLFGLLVILIILCPYLLATRFIGGLVYWSTIFRASTPAMTCLCRLLWIPWSPQAFTDLYGTLSLFEFPGSFRFIGILWFRSYHLCEAHEILIYSAKRTYIFVMSARRVPTLSVKWVPIYYAPGGECLFLMLLAPFESRGGANGRPRRG